MMSTGVVYFSFAASGDSVFKSNILMNGLHRDVLGTVAVVHYRHCTRVQMSIPIYFLGYRVRCISICPAFWVCWCGFPCVPSTFAYSLVSDLSLGRTSIRDDVLILDMVVANTFNSFCFHDSSLFFVSGC